MRIEATVMEKPDGLVGRRRIRIEQVELEGPRADEVLVRVTGCGVCGTDRGCIHNAGQATAHENEDVEGGW